MPNSWKRRYPGFALRVVASITGLFIGLFLVALMSSQSISAADLPNYASKILKTDHTLSKRDIAIIYALCQESSSINFSTRKRIVSSSFLGFERIDISDVQNGEYDSPLTPICTVLFSGGNACRYFERKKLGDSVKGERDADVRLNHAAISAYLVAARGGKRNDQLTESVYSWPDGYGASFNRTTPTMIRNYDVILSKKFVLVPDPVSTFGPDVPWWVTLHH